MLAAGPLGAPRKKKPGTECRAWDGIRRWVGRTPLHPRRLFRRNDVWPVVVGLDVGFVLAGREELR
jgi:hypothetical protein